MQALRLATNIALAALLSPPLFGVMLIVNSVRTGAELLSDLGINQNIVANRRGDTREFYDTAWTIKVLRGLGLGIFCFATAGLFARLFQKPEVGLVLPFLAVTLVLAGFESTTRALLQKDRSVVRLSALDVAIAFASFVVHVGLALISPTIWALILGSVATSAATLVISYVVMPGVRHRFTLDKASAREIFHLGKWVFLSSFVYFLGMHFDRLFFASQVSLSVLGVYSIARVMADMMTDLAIRSSNLILFPTIASLDVPITEIRGRIIHARRTVLIMAALGLATFVSISDLVITTLYDPRYERAAQYLPLLLITVWVTILNVTNEAVLLGTSRPSNLAFANAAKLVVYCVGVPLAFKYLGLMAAVSVLILGEIGRYIVLWIFSLRLRLGTAREDLGLTLVFLLAAVSLRELLSFLGVTGGIQELFPVINGLIQR
jgi:O-antigen/teichoic acid export membrane protein